MSQPKPGPKLATLAGGGSEAWLRFGHRLLWLGLALLALGFVVAAITRRLNFDEALALRAGWLAIQRLPAAPPFYMPTTWLLGLLASTIEDPGAVLLIARLAVVLTVGPALAWSLAACGRIKTAALAATLAFSQATFVVHGLEFRYDWALLLGWLLAYRLVVRRARWDYLWLGVITAWLAAHHLKGVYFAGCLLILAGLAAGIEGDRKRRSVLIVAGLLGGLILWLTLSALFGFGGELADVYTTFFGLAAGTEVRMAPWESLGSTFRRDTVWWLGALLAVVATIWRLPRSRRALLAGRDLWTLGFALAPMGFLFLHPHPWAYMLVLPAPFLALLMAERLADAAPRPAPALVAGGLALVLTLQWAAAGSSPWQAYFNSLAAPRDRQVATLRLLRERQIDGDRIFDPSGLAYFVEPCVSEWYLDTLFEESAERGNWMSDLRQVNLADCAWMLNTYRLRMLPGDLKARFAGDYSLIDGGGGLALHVDDTRLAAPPPLPSLAYRELLSFW
jgi:hypothetical protein